jgi:hypothetical protein
VLAQAERDKKLDEMGPGPSSSKVTVAEQALSSTTSSARMSSRSVISGPLSRAAPDRL